MWKTTLVLFGLATLTLSLKVDLSCRNLSKEEFFLRIQNKYDLHEVTELNLRGNKFNSFLDCSTHLDNLEILDLSHNELKKFFFVCNDEYKLKLLNVSHNHLEYLNDDALNHRLPNLTILDISFNMLKVFNGSMLQHMQNLQFLSLGNNPINDNMHEEAFINLYSLTTLDLSNISASHLSDALFRPLHALENLSLFSNPIKKIPKLPPTLRFLDISQTNVISPADFSLPALRVLLMDSIIDLSSVDLNDFSNLTSLETLSLEDSPNLSSLRNSRPEEGVLPRLQRFSVKNCTLQILDGDLESVMQRVTNLDLQKNPWNCDCNLQWIRGLNLTEGLTREMRCDKPEVYRHIRLFDLPPSELRCNVNLILWIPLSMFIFTVLAVVSYLISSRALSERLQRKKRHETVSYSNVTESTNDLVRILGPAEGHDSAY